MASYETYSPQDTASTTAVVEVAVASDFLKLPINISRTAVFFFFFFFFFMLGLKNTNGSGAV